MSQPRVLHKLPAFFWQKEKKMKKSLPRSSVSIISRVNIHITINNIILTMEDNTMTENDWNNIDLDSRTLFKEFLKRIGATDIEDTHGNCCIDLLFTIKGKRIAVELKRRSFSHSKFGDVFGEAIKLECS